MMKLFIYFYLGLLSLSLFEVKADSVLDIQTPGVEKVEVFARSNFSDQAVKVGETPYKDKLDSFINRFSKVNIVVLELIKKGYKTKSFVLMKGSDFDIKLSVPMEPLTEISKIQEIDSMISELFTIQALIRNQDLDTSLTKLDELGEKFHQFSILPELKGYIYYLRKDVEASLANFRHAFALNSKNITAYKMKVYLEEKLGVGTNAK